MGAASHLGTLTRAQGSLIRELLREKKTRSREGAFVVEGAKFCLDLIRQHPQLLRCLIVSPRYLRAERDVDRQVRAQLVVPQYQCSDSIFDRLTDVDVPQGMLAIVEQPRWNAAQIFNQSRLLGIYGDRLQDPGNVGATIRAAAALNLSGVWLSTGSADPFNPKVVRASAGTIFTLPIFEDQDVRTFSRFGCDLYAAVLPSAHAVPIRRIQKVPHRLIVAVGNEGTGLASEVVKASQVTFAIPLALGVESLNVATTAAISAFYLSGLPSCATSRSADHHHSSLDI